MLERDRSKTQNSFLIKIKFRLMNRGEAKIVKYLLSEVSNLTSRKTIKMRSMEYRKCSNRRTPSEGIRTIQEHSPIEERSPRLFEK